MLPMMEAGCYNCPVKNCTAAYRGSECAANRAKMGEDTASLTRGDYVRTIKHPPQSWCYVEELP